MIYLLFLGVMLGLFGHKVFKLTNALIWGFVFMFLGAALFHNSEQGTIIVLIFIVIGVGLSFLLHKITRIVIGMVAGGFLATSITLIMIHINPEMELATANAMLILLSIAGIIGLSIWGAKGGRIATICNTSIVGSFCLTLAISAISSGSIGNFLFNLDWLFMSILEDGAAALMYSIHFIHYVFVVSFIICLIFQFLTTRSKEKETRKIPDQTEGAETEKVPEEVIEETADQTEGAEAEKAPEVVFEETADQTEGAEAEKVPEEVIEEKADQTEGAEAEKVPEEVIEETAEQKEESELPQDESESITEKEPLEDVNDLDNIDDSGADPNENENEDKS
ncbi:DUF4203 domain-containing protein [bacterium]|nr:DUF4203 domain-containing protein [bacterium]